MSAQAIFTPSVDPLPFTGERMVPHASDLATELFHWQRYLFFRSWYEGKKVVDAASGEGYGTNYIANFANEAIGIDISAEAVDHANARYHRGTQPGESGAVYVCGDVCAYDYSDAELVISFETIEHLKDPSAFLKALAKCRGEIVLSTPNRNTHSPGNRLNDEPQNEFHTIEWTPSEFASLIEAHFEGRPVRFLSQQAVWPGTIREGLRDDANYVIAVIGERVLPEWPRLGIAVPTHNGSARCREMVVGMTRYYPGDIEFAIVDNGSTAQESAKLKQLQHDFPNQVHLITLSNNVGYGIGANTGLEYLVKLPDQGRAALGTGSDQGRAAPATFDYYCVSNDDVIPAVDCLAQMVCAMRELEDAGHRPGAIGPVTNSISGRQLVEIGPYSSYAQMIDRAEVWNRTRHSSATQTLQLRGLCMMIHPDCLETVGGFDPIFGIGNFEDDDHNLRCRLAGFTIWIADGAFLHHHGSSTFKELNVGYEDNIQRNLQLICEKWGFKDFREFLTLEAGSGRSDLFIPFTASIEPSGYAITLNGEVVDLIRQAGDVEFAAYVYNRMQGRPREARLAVIEVLQALNAEAAA